MATTINRIPTDHALIGAASQIPIPKPTRVITIMPVVLPAPNRLIDLQMKISIPSSGTNHPLILLSHGQGYSNNLNSMNGYVGLAHFWASHGFVVFQPTHLSSRSLKFDPAPPSAPLFFRERVEDMSFILDHLDDIEESVPEIKGRIDRSRIAVAGHSMGGNTSSMLMGATLTLPDESGEEKEISLFEPRIKAGVLLAAPGLGGDSLSDLGRQMLRFYEKFSFAGMKTPALVIIGDEDNSPLTVRGAQWYEDPYTESPGPKVMLTLPGGKHGLGGIAGFDAKETTDESPERVAVVERLSWAYLWSQLYPGEKAWGKACEALEKAGTLGKAVEKK